MSKLKKKRKKKKLKKIKLRNPHQQVAMTRSGAGFHKDSREKRQDNKSWKKEIELDS